MWRYFLLQLYVYSIVFVQGERILAHLPTPTFSHNIVYHRILKELSNRGHEVVFITTYPMNDPANGIKEIDVSEVSNGYWKKRFDGAAALSDTNAIDMIAKTMREISDRQLSVAEVETLKKNATEHFDLILVEWVFYYPIYGWAHRFKAPIVGILTLDTFLDGHDFVGNPTHPYLVQASLMDFVVGNGMTLWQRIYSTWISLWLRYRIYSTYPKSDEVLKNHFGEDCPPVKDLAEQVSMVFLAGHNAWAPRPSVPNVVYFDAIHVNPVKPLPSDLQQYLDSSTEGVVYFSLGSNIKSSNLPREKIDIFLKAFAALPYRVLWKWEKDNMEGQTSNVKLAKWLPQQDLLAHKNVRLFMSQGGVQSTEEAIHRHVPMLGIPLLLDQIVNMNIASSKGIAKILYYNDLTANQIVESITEMMTNKSYQRNVERIANLLQDQIVTPLERVIWNLEFVLRHKGLPNDMRVHRIPWWKYFMLDMVALAFLILFMAAVFIRRLYKMIYKMCLCYSPIIREQKVKAN